jgi:hypothetical protein
MQLPELITQYNPPQAPPGHHHRRRGWVQVDCPLCTPGAGRWRLGISEAPPHTAACYHCGRVDLALVLVGWGVPQGRVGATLRALRAGRAGYTPPGPTTAPAGEYRPPAGVGPLLPAHARYLRGRGYSPEALAQVWGLGGLGVAARHSWSIFCPIADPQGRPVAWCLRAITDTGRRWYNGPDAQCRVPVGQCLYGAHWARRGAVVVVEGPSDCWAVGPGAVGVLGVGVAAAQVRALAKWPQRVICFDSSPEAQVRAERLAEALALHPGQTTVVVLDAEDPGSASRAEIDALRRAYLPMY